MVAKLASLLSARWLHDVLQFFLFIYLARVNSTTYGQLQLALNLGGILLMVGEFGLNLPLVGLLTRKETDSRQALSQVLFLKAGSLALAGVGVVGFVTWQGYASPLFEVALIISAGFALEALASTFFTALQVQGRQVLESRIRGVSALLGFGYGLTALFLGASPLAIALFKPLEGLVNLAGSAAAVGLQGLWRWPSLVALRATLRLVLVFAVMEVTAILYNKANVFFLQRYGGSEAVAQYSVTWVIVDGCSILATTLVMQSILFPLFVRFWDEDRKEVSRLAHASARWLLGVALATIFILFFESDRFIPLIYGPGYQDAVWLQRYLVFTIFFAFLHNLSAFLMISMRLERVLAAIYLGGLVFNLLFCWLVVPRAPLLGAALAIILTKGGIAILSFTFIQRRFRFFPWRDLAHLGGAALVGVTVLVAGGSVLHRNLAGPLAFFSMMGLLTFWWRFKYREVGLGD